MKLPGRDVVMVELVPSPPERTEDGEVCLGEGLGLRCVGDCLRKRELGILPAGWESQ